jgi:hypothetical protein
MDANGTFPVPVIPELWLVGNPPSDKSGVTLPTDHWVELGFSGPIGDGPGADILVTEQGKRGEQALVLVRDGAHCPYPIGIAKAETTGDQATTEIPIDLAGMKLPFVPTQVRIVSLGLGGAAPGFDVGSVQARVLASQTPQAAYPSPADRAQGVSARVVLRWRAGLAARGHVVYFGSTAADVGEQAQCVQKPQQPQAGTQFDPGPLELGRTYYWRLDEVADDQGTVVRGDIWRFEVAPCEQIEGFESSLSPWQFAEGRVAWAEASRSPGPVYEGCQSMALHFGVWPDGRTGMARVFDEPQDWAALKAQTLQLAFQGHPDNALAPRLYVTLSDGRTEATATWEGDLNAIHQSQWHLWKIPLASLRGLDLSRVRSLVVGLIGDPASYAWGVVYLDALSLCAPGCDQALCRRTDLNCDCRVDYRDLARITQQWLDTGVHALVTREPNRPAAWFPFDGDADDHIGSIHGQIEGQPGFVTGQVGQALSLAGITDLQSTPDQVVLTGVEPLFQSLRRGLTVAFWQNGTDSAHNLDSLICSDFEYGRMDPALHIALGCWNRPGLYQWHCGSPWTLDNTLCGAHRNASEWAGQWNHWAFTLDLSSGQRAVFLNGAPVASGQGSSADLGKIRSLTIGNGWYGYYDGLLDELRIYDYPLSPPEVAYLATNGSGYPQSSQPLEADLNRDGQVDWADFALLAQDWLAGPLTD